MEEALLGQKQIRHYFQCFSEQQWQRVAKATMMLGIQHVMGQNQKEHLFWDFSKLSIQELEDLVVDNEMYLMQRQKMYKGRRARSPPGRAQIVMDAPVPQPIRTGDMVVAKKIGPPAPVVNPRKPSSERQDQPIIMERPNEQQTSVQAVPRVKRVTVVEEVPPADTEEDQSSVIPQLSIQGKEDNKQPQMQEILQQANANADDKAATITDKVGSKVFESEPKTAKSSSVSRSPTEKTSASTNMRNNPEFARHKSSKAMSQLLRADDAVLNKQKRIANVAKSRQPSQKEIVNQRVGVHQPPNDSGDQSQQLPRAQSRSVGSGSRGRPSSKWRDGVTRDNIDEAEEESALNALDNQNKRIVYPDWWEGRDEIEKEAARKEQMINDDPNRMFAVANPTKAKVNRNLQRYAEDSLDARLRQVRDDVATRAAHDDMIYVQEQHQGYRKPSHERGAEQKSVGYSEPIRNSQKKRHRRKNQQQQNIHPNVNGNFPGPRDAYMSQGSMDPSLYSSNGQLPSNNAVNSSSTKRLNMLDSTGPNHLSRTHGSQSQGSFAYTSNKAVPKYSPARQPRAGASNIPMSYAGPPSRQERDRDRDRRKSGNRNFSNAVSQEDFMLRQQDGSLDTRLNRMNDQQRYRKPLRQQQDQHAVGLQNETQEVYFQQQREAERNRKRIEDEIRRQSQQQDGTASQEESREIANQTPDNRVEQSRHDTDGGGGMRKYARGGVAITISASPEQEERERSGSKPKFPFMDLDPFRGHEIPHPARENSNEAALREQRRSTQRAVAAARSQSSVERLYQQRKIPQQYQSVESSIKSKIDYDRRQHLEKQRVKEMRQYQDRLAVESSQQQNETQQDLQAPDAVQPQIFYKKNDSKVVYEEGVDDSFIYPYRQKLEEHMRHQELQKQNLTNAIDSIRQKKAHKEEKGHGQQSQYQQEPGTYLRRRDVSPQTKEALNNGYYNIADNQMRPSDIQSYPYTHAPGQHLPQDQIELQMQVRQSRDYHNETGFTQKLLGQGSNQTGQNLNERSSYGMSNPSNPSSSQEPNRNGTILSSDQTQGHSGGQDYYRGAFRPPAPPFSNGYYDEQGRYHERGDISRWQQQIHPPQDRANAEVDPEDSYDATESDENKNNTSRFAFGGPTTEQRYPGERAYQESRTDPRMNDGRDPREVGGAFHGQNNSTIPHNEDSSSIITPNVSYGGRAQLQNQLEQVLMMKSGEFSAGRRQNDTQYRSGGSMVNINEETGVNASHYSQTLGQRPEHEFQRPGHSQPPSAADQQSYKNYGNPNFMPPPSQQAPFVIERRDRERDGGRISFRGYGEEGHNQGSQYAYQQQNYREQYPMTYQRYDGRPQHPRGYQDSEEYNSGGDANRNFNTSQFPNHEGRPSDGGRDPRELPTELSTGHARDYKRQDGPQKSNSRSLYGAQPLPEQIAYQQQAFVPQGGNNFTLQRPSRSEFAVPDRRMTEPAAPRQNYQLEREGPPGREEALKEGGRQLGGSPYRGSRQQQESYESKDQKPADGAHLDYRISSGKSLRKNDRADEESERQHIQQVPLSDAGADPGSKPSKNYQTFNEEDSSQQQPQPPYEGGQQLVDGSDMQNRVELFNQPSETEDGERRGQTEADHDMDMGEDHMGDEGDLMGTSQVSASNTPASHHNGNMDGSQNMNEASMVTANLRNFMEQAQPAEGLLNSQGPPGASSPTNARRLQSQAPTQEEQFDLRKKTGPSGEPSSRTEDKEGGSLENAASIGQRILSSNGFDQAVVQQDHGNEESPARREDRIYRDMTEESSPDISQTEQTSQILSPDKAGFTNTEGTNDDGDISSSLQETPMSGSKKHTPSNYASSSHPTTTKRDLMATAQNQVLQSDNYDLQQNIKRITEQAQKLTEQLQHMQGSHSQSKSLVDSQSNAPDSQASPQKEARQNPRASGSHDSQSDSLSPLRDSEL